MLDGVRKWLAGRISPKAVPEGLTGGQWTGTSYVDAYKRNREPTANELLAELKGTAWTCASINASVCANFPPRLYVTTQRNQSRPKCQTRELGKSEEKSLRGKSGVPAICKTRETRIEEVQGHPLLDLFAAVNPFMNSFDLWEVTTLYLEVHGSAYWLLSKGAFAVPEQVWILPSQNVVPKRKPDSANVIDYYEYRTGSKHEQYAPEEVIHFRYPDPRDPYTRGLSPLRACYEQVALTSEYAATKWAVYQNQAIPSAIISPDEVMGEEERDRLEAQWNSKFRRGGAGKVVVGESGLKVQVLQHSMGDLAALADMKMTKEDICNAFHVPLSFLTSETNLANLQAADHQHMAKAISPRLQRRDQKINEQLVPLYDPSGRLFVASEDPVPLNAEQTLSQMQADMKYGIVTINEVRQERGLSPVPWGDLPWLPVNMAPSDQPRTGKVTGVSSDEISSNQ